MLVRDQRRERERERERERQSDRESDRLVSRHRHNLKCLIICLVMTRCIVPTNTLLLVSEDFVTERLCQTFVSRVKQNIDFT